MNIKYNDGQPCEHKGCLSHLSHLCEGCGRIGGRGVVYYDEERNMMYILPQVDKSLKIVFDELPCPILSQLGDDFRCKHSKSKVEDMHYIIYCSKEDCKIERSIICNENI
jgi:hypothetical protein